MKMSCACAVTSVLEFGTTDHSYTTHFRVYVFTKRMTFTCNSIEIILGVKWEERGMSAQNTQTAKESKQFENQSLQPRAIREKNTPYCNILFMTTSNTETDHLSHHYHTKLIQRAIDGEIN